MTRWPRQLLGIVGGHRPRPSIGDSLDALRAEGRAVWRPPRAQARRGRLSVRCRRRWQRWENGVGNAVTRARLGSLRTTVEGGAVVASPDGGRRAALEPRRCDRCSIADPGPAATPRPVDPGLIAGRDVEQLPAVASDTRQRTDADQARFGVDAMAGFVARSGLPGGLRGAVASGDRPERGTDRGPRRRWRPTYGLRPDLMVVDELASGDAQNGRAFIGVGDGGAEGPLLRGLRCSRRGQIRAHWSGRCYGIGLAGRMVAADDVRVRRRGCRAIRRGGGATGCRDVFARVFLERSGRLLRTGWSPAENSPRRLTSGRPRSHRTAASLSGWGSTSG